MRILFCMFETSKDINVNICSMRERESVSNRIKSKNLNMFSSSFFSYKHKQQNAKSILKITPQKWKCFKDLFLFLPAFRNLFPDNSGKFIISEKSVFFFFLSLNASEKLEIFTDRPRKLKQKLWSFELNSGHAIILLI